MNRLLTPVKAAEIMLNQRGIGPATVLHALRLVPKITWVLAVLSFAVHFLALEQYGFFRDELYYIACGNHLAFGYVDQPPLIAVIARLSAVGLGTTICSYRFFPALASVLLILLTARLTREFGGSRFDQTLSSLAVSLTPIYLAFGSFLSMNAFEPVFWMICALILVRLLKGADQRLWLLFGAVAAIGLQNKHTMLLFGFAVIVGLCLAGDWKQFRSKWLWLGVGIAVFIFVPNLIWEAQHDWPQIEVVRNAQRIKNIPVGVARFLGEQSLFLDPVAAPMVLAGLAWLFLSKTGRRFRSLGWSFLIIIAVVKLLHGKTYYPTPFYAILLAAGAAAFGDVLRQRARLVAMGYTTLLGISGLLLLPFGVPILSLQTFLRYQNHIPLQSVVQVERDSSGELPQLYADMSGWDSMVRRIADVYESLSPSDRSRCAILAGNYGEAGAIDVLGRRYNLPHAISGHNSYYLWGTNGHTGEVVILFGQNAESIKTQFWTVEQVATISGSHSVSAENYLPIYVCRHPKEPLTTMWRSLRYYE